MSVLTWEKPKKLKSSEEHAADYSADGAPPGVYVPNMSAEDQAKWKAKVVGANTGYPQVEIRKNGFVLIISSRGYKYKNYNTRDMRTWGRRSQPVDPKDVPGRAHRRGRRHPLHRRRVRGVPPRRRGSAEEAGGARMRSYKFGFTLHVPFWDRIKMLFGWGMRIEVEGVGSITQTRTYVESYPPPKLVTVQEVKWP
jgi:hypothetical protein